MTKGSFRMEGLQIGTGGGQKVWFRAKTQRRKGFYTWARRWGNLMSTGCEFVSSESSSSDGMERKRKIDKTR